MRCPRCGRESPEDVSFCSACGNAIGGGQAFAPTAHEATTKKSSQTSVIVVVVVVIVVAIVGLAIIAALAFRGAVEDALETDVKMSVLGAAEVADPFWVPQSGYRFIELTVEMTNNEDSALILHTYEFKIVATDGASYSAIGSVGGTMPSAIAAGYTVTFIIAFEIPVDKTPTKLVYHDLFSSNEVEASIGVVTPVVYKITMSDISVGEVTDAYYPPDDGYIYVNVSVTMTNGYDEAISLYSFDFELMTSDGLIFDCTWGARDSIPDGLAAGATATFYMAFEVPVSAIPDTLIYDCGGFVVEAEI